MKKRILIVGASGMVGREVLNQALSSTEVAEVTSLVRKKMDVNHPKLTQHLVTDFSDYKAQASFFEKIDAAYFCIGAYTGQVSDAQFKAITLDYAVAFAKQLLEQSPHARLCLLSGAGADRTEKSKTAFARYKGMAENQIIGLGISFHSFRPGYIYPVSARKEPNVMYTIMRWLYPVLKVLGDSASITSVQLAKAMLFVGLQGHEKQILENADILKVKTPF